MDEVIVRTEWKAGVAMHAQKSQVRQRDKAMLVAALKRRVTRWQTQKRAN